MVGEIVRELGGADRRTHYRVTKPDLFVRLDGYVYQPEDASLGGFSICPYDGPLWDGDEFEGELLEPNGKSHPFSGAVVRHQELKSKLSCRFIALSDPGFDALTRGISSQYTARNALEELEQSGRASDAFLTRLKRLPLDVLAQFDRQQLDALRRVFDNPDRSHHSVDRRLVFRIFGRHYYFVLLAGRDFRGERRRHPPPERRGFNPFSWVADMIVRIVFIGIVLGLIALPLYAIKMVAGIDILEESGVHYLLKLLTDQLSFML